MQLQRCADCGHFELNHVIPPGGGARGKCYAFLKGTGRMMDVQNARVWTGKPCPCEAFVEPSS